MLAHLNAIFGGVCDMKVSKKISVIGGSGFVGTNLCQALADRQIPFEIIDIKQSQRFPEKCKIGDVRGRVDRLNQLRCGRSIKKEWQKGHCDQSSFIVSGYHRPVIWSKAKSWWRLHS